MLPIPTDSVSDLALADELATLLATETRSLVRHVLGDAKPYVSSKTLAVWTRLQQLARQSEEHAARLSALIERLELPPRTIPYDTSVSFYHYMTVESLLPKLIEEKGGQIKSYETAISHAAAYPAAVAELQKLLAENKAQLTQLTLDSKSLSPATAV